MEALKDSTGKYLGCLIHWFISCWQLPLCMTTFLSPLFISWCFFSWLYDYLDPADLTLVFLIEYSCVIEYPILVLIPEGLWQFWIWFSLLVPSTHFSFRPFSVLVFSRSILRGRISTARHWQFSSLSWIKSQSTSSFSLAFCISTFNNIISSFHICEIVSLFNLSNSYFNYLFSSSNLSYFPCSDFNRRARLSFLLITSSIFSFW